MVSSMKSYWPYLICVLVLVFGILATRVLPQADSSAQRVLRAFAFVSAAIGLCLLATHWTLGTTSVSYPLARSTFAILLEILAGLMPMSLLSIYGFNAFPQKDRRRIWALGVPRWMRVAYYGSTAIGAGMFFLGPHPRGALDMGDRRLLVTFGGLALIFFSAYFVTGYSYLRRPQNIQPLQTDELQS